MPEAMLNKRIINEKTLLPISIVVMIIALAVTFGTVRSMVVENKERIHELQEIRMNTDRRIFDQINQLRDKVTSVSEHVYSINGKIDIIIIKLGAHDDKSR